MVYASVRDASTAEGLEQELYDLLQIIQADGQKIRDIKLSCSADTDQDGSTADIYVALVTYEGEKLE